MEYREIEDVSCFDYTEKIPQQISLIGYKKRKPEFASNARTQEGRVAVKQSP